MATRKLCASGHMSLLSHSSSELVRRRGCESFTQRGLLSHGPYTTVYDCAWAKDRTSMGITRVYYGLHEATKRNATIYWLLRRGSSTSKIAT